MNQKVRIEHYVDLEKKRHKFENTFTRIQDWRRVANRYVRCADLFPSACALAAVVMFGLRVLTLAVRQCGHAIEVR